MLKIGFVDHHLNNFHANKFLTLLHGPLADLEARVVAAWESDPTGGDWCAEKGVRRLPSAEAVAEEVDAVMVLAPDNIDDHLALCRLVLPAGKRTLVDKFLCPSLSEARQLVRLAEQHTVDLFSASALRFAVELEAALTEAGGPVAEAFARGMGDWELYGVHTLSMAVRAMGPAVERVIDTGTRNTASVTLDYGASRRAVVDVRAAANMWETLQWSFGLQIGERYVTGTVRDFDGFYSNLMRRAVHFFRTGDSPVTVEEMLNLVGILETARESREADGEWIDL